MIYLWVGGWIGDCGCVCARARTHIYFPSSCSYNQHVICFKCAGGWVNVRARVHVHVRVLERVRVLAYMHVTICVCGSCSHVHDMWLMLYKKASSCTRRGKHNRVHL